MQRCSARPARVLSSLALLPFAPRWQSAAAALLVALVAALAVAPPARAGTIVPNPVDAVYARFLLTGTTTGLPAGAIVLGGSVGAGDEVLLFTLEYTAAPSVAFTQIAVDRLGDAPFTAIGWIPGTGVDWTAAVQPLPELAFFQSGALVTGAVTDVFFVAATGFTPGESFAFVSSSPSGGLGGTGNAQWVPEPGTLALLAGGLALLARARRR